MFIEPSIIKDRNRFKKINGIYVCCCTESHLVKIKLILHDETRKRCYTLLMCINIPLSYITDMYKLFTKLEILEIRIKQEHIKSIEGCFLEDGMRITMILPHFYDPKLWLFKPFQNILFYRYKKYCSDESLELYVNSLSKIIKYYVIGNDSIVMISTENENNTIILCTSTINMLLERSRYCNRPFIYELEFQIEAT